MGNDLSKCCTNVDLSEAENNQLKLKVDKTKSRPNKEKEIIKIQSSYRRFFAISRLKILIQSIQKEIFENIGRNVEEDEIRNRRGKNLIRIEEYFENNYSEGIRMKKYFDETIINTTASRKNKIKKIFNTICFKSTLEIYEGYWELEYKDGLFLCSRNGYGSLYLLDGTKIVGIWSGDSIVNQGIIYHNNGKIFIGEISTLYEGDLLKYKENGKGRLFYFKDHILKQTITGIWNMGTLSGECIIDNIGKFTVKSEIINGQINYNKGFFKYHDGSSYEGQFNDSFQRNGYGKIIYVNGETYEGNWKKDKYHGEGVLFKPEFSSKSLPHAESDYEKNANFNDKNDSSNNSLNNTFTKGIVTKSTWVEGMLHGKGFVNVNNKITENIWRYGKLIRSIYLLGSKKIEIHENILLFLTFEEKTELIKLNNKKINFGLSKNSQFFDLLKLYKIGSIDIKNYPLLEKIPNKSKKLPCFFNKFILENLSRVTNKNLIFDNYSYHSSSFLPIVGFYTNGGTVQKRLHYSNTFIPDFKTAYSTNYLYQKKNDIILSGVINPDMTINNQNLLPASNRNHNEEFIINNLLQKSSHHLIQYEQMRKEYKYDLNKFSITDVRILDKCLNNSGMDCLFTVHNIIIDCPIKLSLYTILGNPVKTLAVYIYNRLSENFKDSIKESFISDYNPLENSENLENLLSKLKSSYTPIKIDNNPRNIVIEFDTQEQSNKESDYVKLLALIVLKDYNKPHLISFKRYYHLGRFITLKLIDQSTFYNYKKTGIDLGSALFFGEIYKLTK